MRQLTFVRMCYSCIIDSWVDCQHQLSRASNIGWRIAWKLRQISLDIEPRVSYWRWRISALIVMCAIWMLYVSLGTLTHRSKLQASLLRAICTIGWVASESHGKKRGWTTVRNTASIVMSNKMGIFVVRSSVSGPLHPTSENYMAELW